jgi:hypothetical protein
MGIDLDRQGPSVSHDSLQAQMDLIQLLLLRLARISADSAWAYKASGLRGSLLRCLDQLEARAAGQAPASAGGILEQADRLTDYGFEILEKVARGEA